jgi:hypothetical protein
MRIKDFRLSRLIILLIMMKFIASCTADACLEETNSFLNATFYRVGGSKPSAPDSITVYGIGKESNKLYSKSLNVKTIKLPLDASSGSCGFVMKINVGTDTLKLNYSSYPHLISKECGITFFYALDSLRVNGTAVDTIIVMNKNITTFNGENIRILY